MTLMNREVFSRDPAENRIPNGGVAKVSEPENDTEWRVLRHELTTFVCEGEYERGLERILDTYLGNVGKGDQPAVWVSGFYGSGKSHLVRVLEFLWRDIGFSDGATARSVADLPESVMEKLRELDTAGRREGGLWSAAGTLGAGAGESVRLAILGIFFEAAGLPRRYSRGRFTLWLKQMDLFDRVKDSVESEGRDFGWEVDNLYVSPYLARGLLEAYPGFAESEAEVRSLLRAQFPGQDDISDDEMLDGISDVLKLVSTNGKTPCTLLVLDELQQYIGDNPDRTLRVQQAVEACTSRFEGKLLFVATGQSALQGTQQLQKLQGRFTVQISLSDADVEEVVRKVVLRKSETKKPELQAVLDQNSGEIDKQLSATRIRPTQADNVYLVPDYPLLPVRRRFWELVLRTIDRAGAAGQLRTQLRIVQEATEEVADREVGNVVAADFVYDQLTTAMLNSGVLLKDVHETIQDQKDGTEDGLLRSRLCSLIFLIGQFPRDAGGDSGLRATPEMLADLLVEDIRGGSANLKGRIPALLEGMVEAGNLMSLDGEYRIQTREGAEWTGAYQSTRARFLGDDARIADDRSRELREAAGRALKGLGFVQGEGKVPRKAEIHFGLDRPKPSGNVPVWVRDGWSVTENQARQEAQAAGREDSVVHVYLPRKSPEDLKKAIASHEAAREVVSVRSVPTTQEGKEARAAIEGIRQADRSRLDAALDGILRDARVFLGGGSEVGEGGDLKDNIQRAGYDALGRLYPRFDEADSAKWPTVMKRAKEGNGDALSQVGYQGDAEKHVVSREMLAFVGPGRKGKEIRAKLGGAPYGWSQDAVDAVISVLVHGQHLRVSVNGTAETVRSLDQKKISNADFKAESLVLTMPQRLEIRKLLSEAGVEWRSDEEPQAARRFIEQMLSLAGNAGGTAPLPATPAATHLQDLKNREGNELLLGVYGDRDRFREEMKTWKETADKAKKRLPDWNRFTNMLRHAGDLESGENIGEQARAIEAERTLLDEPDPITPLLSELTDLLREQLNAAHKRYEDAFDGQMESLSSSDSWGRLTDSQSNHILSRRGIAKQNRPKVESGATVLDSLNETSLSEWENLTLALESRFGQAQTDAVTLLQPKAVKVRPPQASLSSEAEAEEYVDALREEILVHIREGRPVIL